LDNLDSGFVAPASMNRVIDPGTGYWVWCGDAFAGTSPFTIDVPGPINKGDIDLPVSFNSSGNLADDGWSLVGNPYPSSINWDNGTWTKTNVDNATYIFDPDNQQFATYVGGSGNNGGSEHIASSQAFWVKANAASPVLTATENVKSDDDTPFFKQSSLPFRINVSKGNFADQVSFRVNAAATTDFDGNYDALKMYSSNPNVPSICAIATDNNELSINSFNTSSVTTIPVKVTANTSGLSQLTFENIAELNGFNCVYLEDLQTGTFVDVLTSSGYDFYLYDTTSTARFVLHLQEVIADFNAVDTVNLAVNNGEFIPVNTSSNTSQYLWDFGDNTTSTAANPVHNYTQPGLYTVTLEILGLQSCTQTKVKQVRVIDIAIITAINELPSSTFNLYPNPIKIGQQLHLELPNTKNYKIHIIDVLGKVVLEDNIHNGAQSLSIGTNFGSGIYFVHVYDENNEELKRIKLMVTE